MLDKESASYAFGRVEREIEKLAEALNCTPREVATSVTARLESNLNKIVISPPNHIETFFDELPETQLHKQLKAAPKIKGKRRLSKAARARISKAQIQRWKDKKKAAVK